MCLAIPGKLLEIRTDDNGVRMGKADFGGILKQVCLEYTPEVQTGDYVLVHVGFALNRVDPEAAARTYKALEDLQQLSELQVPEVDAASPSGCARPGRSNAQMQPDAKIVNALDPSRSPAAEDGRTPAAPAGQEAK